MSNLYEFLRAIQKRAKQAGMMNVVIEPEQLEWLDQYLQAPDVEIHFKARRVGGTDEDPVMAQDYAIAGNGVDVFSLLTEAMLANYQFATQVRMAADFYKEHVPKCPDCSKLAFGMERPPINWNFSPHKPLD